jgi:hypothetical protein
MVAHRTEHGGFALEQLEGLEVGVVAPVEYLDRDGAVGRAIVREERMTERARPIPRTIS